MSDAETEPFGFLGGRVTLLRRAGGHRPGLDAALLQACVPCDATGTLVDLGAGSGAVGFSALSRAGNLRAVMIERDASALDLLRSALALPDNRDLADRATILAHEIGGSSKPKLDRARASHVVMNPPFNEPTRHRTSPDPERADAHASEGVEAWLDLAVRLLAPQGRLSLIDRPERLPLVLAALDARLGGIDILPAHPREGTPANRFLLSGTRGSRAATRLLPGLVLHTGEGGWRADIDAILRGEADLSSRLRR